VARLSQINALVAGQKKRSDAELNELYHLLQRSPGLLSGLIRRYMPRDDEGEQLPGESTRVQTRVEAEVLPRIAGALARMFDLQLTQDDANCTARADVIVGGATILQDVPVTYLLYLEKTLVDLRTVIGKLPVLDQADTWEWDNEVGVYRSAVVETVRSKKIPRNHVRAEATEKHAAQVDVWHEDVPVGTWSTTKLSGAVPAEHVRSLDNRAAQLIDAVRIARDNANAISVDDRQAAGVVFGFLFGGLVPAA
jgi:hypothetical protein